MSAPPALFYGDHTIKPITLNAAEDGSFIKLIRETHMKTSDEEKWENHVLKVTAKRPEGHQNVHSNYNMKHF